VDAAKPHQKKEDITMEDQPFQDEAPQGEDAEMALKGPRPISEKKLEANRRNAQKSTGPVTEAGKHRSSMNAMQHGLLARAVPITVGDYRENAVEFQNLLDSLRDRYQPFGAGEELEIEAIAQGYWIKCRLARWVNAITREKSLGLRGRQVDAHAEAFEEMLKSNPDRLLLEQTARGVRFILDRMDEVKKHLQDQKVSRPGAASTSLQWLIEEYPDDFAPSEETYTQLGKSVMMTPEYIQQIAAAIDKQSVRLKTLWIKRQSAEEQEIEAHIEVVAALPFEVYDEKIGRYAARNDREIDRAFARLEKMQAGRRATGRIWPNVAS
jgi:hypothetical protein